MNTRHDSAYYYLNKVTIESKDSLQIAQAYNRMAVIQNREGDYYGGQESLLTSSKFLHADRENDQYCLVSNYNLLGNTSLNLKNYDAAIGYYNQAYRQAKDDRSKSVALNNQAKAFQEMGNYSRAASIYESILPQSKADKKEYARVLNNLASVRWQRDSNYPAAPDLLTALTIRKDSNDDWGLNSSYAHLADYYSRSRPDSALMFTREMFDVASRLNSPDDQLEALDKLIRLSPAREVKPYFQRYRTLKDSLETGRNNAKNQFALIRFESEKTKADNLRLHQENAVKAAQVIWQQAITAGAIIALVVLAGFVINWNRKRKQKLEWARERAKQEERMQISQRVHDVVANGLYQVMKEMEYAQNVANEELMDKIEILYNQSRDISYEPEGTWDGECQVVLARLLSAFGNADRKVATVGNDQALWTGVHQRIKRELKPILQELMINMDKHSGARNVLVRFHREKQGLLVQYQDDGVGMPADQGFGNGLTNTGNRIAGIDGRISFEPNKPKGLVIRIFLPND